MYLQVFHSYGHSYYVFPTTSSFNPVSSEGVHNPQYPPHLPLTISPLYNIYIVCIPFSIPCHMCPIGRLLDFRNPKTNNSQPALSSHHDR